MAIYSLRMTAIGKTTQAQPFTAAAHLKYITRTQAVTHTMAARMPERRREAIAWLKRQERADRKNARVADKLVLALPRELSPVHQHALVKAFADALTLGRASWFAAFHTSGKDTHNPHCHLIVRDRDAATGKRVMFLSAGKKEAAQRAASGKSAPTTVTKIRELWERFANAALEVAGRSERIDRRSLKDQGVARRAQVHEGPNIRGMHKRGYRPQSRDRVVRNPPHRRRGRPATRVVRYAAIDHGLTRAEFNDRLRADTRLSADAGRVRPAATTARSASPALSAYFASRSVEPAMTPLSPAVQTRSRLPEPADDQTTPHPPSRPDRPMSLTEQLALEHGLPAAQPTRSEPRSPARRR